MPTETRKSRSHSAGPAKKGKRKRSSKKRSSSAKSAKREVDILSPAAMENVYYISHNAVDCLEFRELGFPVPHCTAQARSSAAALRLVPYRAISSYFSPGAAAPTNPAAAG
ncbi:hypothetical protein AGOR_G00231670 [Albula goreensis]|uniref:Uncharacterized protein n=1 Tax=Albula goreensis TaxID=1534307 RepID=A0A8T3CI26_9TELE|nr:hypothetical protein AGOR_G00231670 [Albula goreensis]